MVNVTPKPQLEASYEWHSSYKSGSDFWITTVKGEIIQTQEKTTEMGSLVHTTPAAVAGMNWDPPPHSVFPRFTHGWGLQDQINVSSAFCKSSFKATDIFGFQCP